MNSSILCKTCEETKELAGRFARSLKKEDIVLFYGDLGAGKTFFIRESCMHIGIDPCQVTSPSFNIVKTYTSEGSGITVHHFDLYRMQRSHMVDFFEFEDYIDEKNNILFIEWADRLKNPAFPGRVISVTIRISNSTQREFTIDPWIFLE